jgi:hypothetical protein
LARLSFDHLLSGKFHPRHDADWEFLRAAAQNLFKPKAPIDDQKLVGESLDEPVKPVQTPNPICGIAPAA